jgi:aspartyl-tRNA(Asn)/glutamyl-tRNA(Gln) amidotransferase subunit B
MFKSGADPSNLIEEKGLSLIKNEAEIEGIIKKVLSENQKVVEDFKRGKKESLQFLMGKVMAVTKGRVDPEITLDLLNQILDTLS